MWEIFIFKFNRFMGFFQHFLKLLNRFFFIRYVIKFFILNLIRLVNLCLFPRVTLKIKEWYVNELRLYSNESDPDDRITKNDLKELKVTTYTDKMRCTF